MTYRISVTFVLLSIAIYMGISANLGKLTNIFLNSIEPRSDHHSYRFLNFTELSGQNGFVTDEHTVTTEDGYILTVFRMKSKDCVEFKSPVLLMHGLIQSADAWLDAGPKNGLAYLIAAECYDLWVGNQRGNYYGRRHVRLDPDRDADFWQFSADEIGMYDIPATVDYILRNTKKDKLNYIGFSQGAGTCVIMCSERPGYCDKINLFIALAPATRIMNIKSKALRAIFQSVNKLQGILSLAGVHEVFTRESLVQGLIEQLCRFATTYSVKNCSNMVELLDSFHPGSIDEETLQLMATHLPAGSSIQTLARYGQSLQVADFQKFDYGKSKNVATYGTEQPPIYNLTAVTAPVALLYGRNDHMTDSKDVLWLSQGLPNVLKIKEIPHSQWNHFDMVYSRHIMKILFPEIIRFLKNY